MKYIVRFIKFIFMCFIWKSIYSQQSDLGKMTVNNLLTYTLLSSAFTSQFNVVTPATAALWEGSIIGRYIRPQSVFYSMVAETLGKWTMPLLCYTLPVFLVSPLLGINPLPANNLAFILFVISMGLSISIGFALDFVFASIAIRLKNACWAAQQIKNSLITIVSGAAIPLYLFPEPVERVLNFLPFSSIASAPLNIYVGAENPINLIIWQVFWNLILWPVSIKIFNKSEERMISYGG